MKRTITINRFLPNTQEQVWHALTDAATLGRWFMQNDLVPVVGHEFTFQMAPQKGWDGITHCTVTHLAPMSHIAYTYRGQASGEKTLACAGIHSDKADKIAKGIFTKLDTTLSFNLSPTCGGTMLQLKHAGFKGFKMVLISYVFQLGWKKQVKRLQGLLDKQKL